MTCEEWPGSKTKNPFLRDKKGLRHLLVSVPPDRAVELNGLGVILGAGRLGFASAERLHKHLGITAGADRQQWDDEADERRPTSG